MENRKKIVIGKKKIVIKGSKKKTKQERLLMFIRANKIPVFILAFSLFIAIVGMTIWLSSFKIDKKVLAEKIQEEKIPMVDTVELQVQSKTEFEYPDLLPEIANEASFNYTKEIIEKNIPLKEFLLSKRINASTSTSIAFKAKFIDLFDLKMSHAFYTFKADEVQTSSFNEFYIYEISIDSFAVILTEPETEIMVQTIPLETKTKEIGGLVEHNFFGTSFLKHGGDFRLIPKLLNALKWQIDFYHVKPNDKYKFVYEEKWYNGKQVGVGDLLAAFYEHQNEKIYAFRFEDNDNTAYFDNKGRAMKMQFLMSPVEYNIINSSYNPNRIHPVLNKEMPHYGTDYFANLNDPVFAVGKGKIMKARKEKNNGNNVKIWHSDKYQTQYLHLNEFAKGIRPGVWVEQGQVIGYAGQTGLATGVHVCFRFWMDGKQVDHTKKEVFQNNKSAGQIKNFENFVLHRDSLMDLLETMEIN